MGTQQRQALKPAPRLPTTHGSVSPAARACSVAVRDAHLAVAVASARGTTAAAALRQLNAMFAASAAQCQKWR